MRSILIITLFLASTCLMAQDEPNKKYILGISGSYSEATDMRYTSLSTKIGGITGKRLALGVDFEFVKVWADQRTLRQLAFGPFARYYFTFDKLGFFLGAEVAYASFMSKGMLFGIPQNRQYERFLYGPTAGLNAFITRSVTFEFLVNYRFAADVEQLQTSEMESRGKVGFEAGLTFFL